MAVDNQQANTVKVEKKTSIDEVSLKAQATKAEKDARQTAMERSLVEESTPSSEGVEVSPDLLSNKGPAPLTPFIFETPVSIAEDRNPSPDMRIKQLKADGVIDASERAEYQLLLADQPTIELPTPLNTVSETEPNDDCTSADTVACGDTIWCATLTDGSDESDYYTFTIGTDQNVTIETHATAGACDPAMTDTYIYLYNSDCTVTIASNDDGGVGLFSLIQLNLAAGTYVVESYNYWSNTGSYHMSILCTDPLPLWNCTDTPPDGKLPGGNIDVEPNDVCTQAVIAECEYAYCGEITTAADSDWYAITIPSDQTYALHIRVFGDDTPNQYAFGLGLDPRVELWSPGCGSMLTYNEDYYGTFPDAETYDSQIDPGDPGNCFDPGSTVYIKVWTYYEEPGPYLLIINCVPCEICDVTCPATDPLVEAEAFCMDTVWYQNYEDTTNGGCNSIVPVFQYIDCGDTVCGQLSTWVFADTSSNGTPPDPDTLYSGYRDTDWFEFTTTQTLNITISGAAEVPFLLFLIDAGSGDCTDYAIVSSITADPCSLATMTIPEVPPGTYYAWAGPSVFGQTVYPCPADYWMAVECELPIGRCCYNNDLDCLDTDEATCIGLGGEWDVDLNCTDNPCICPEDQVVIEILTDDYPSETTWQLFDANSSSVIAAGGPYTGNPNTLFTEEVCVPDTTCLVFTIYDAFGDGICCDYGNGYYNVYFNGALEGTGGAFADSESVGPFGSNCTLVGRCCYGDPGNPDCMDTDDLTCAGLGGTWSFGLNCTDNPCPVVLPGDNCDNPIVVGSIPYSDLNQYTCGRIDDYDATCLGFYDGGEDIIYEFTLASDTCVQVTVDFKTTTYGGFCVDFTCPPDPSTCIAVVTGGSSGVKSTPSLQLAAGTYYIMVDTWPSPDCIPDFDLFIDYVDCPTIPANDLCDDAIAVTVPSSTAGTTEYATVDDNAPECGTEITAPGVWYSVIGTGNTMTATTCDSATTYDSKLSVYCGGCADPVCIDGNDDDCALPGQGLNSTVTWCSNVGEEYLILVHGFSSGSGPFLLDISDDGIACQDPIPCFHPTGACCLADETCTDGLTESECIVLGGYAWFVDELCADITCPLNCANSEYSNGPDDFVNVFASQCDVANSFVVETADDFVLGADATINTISAYIGFWWNASCGIEALTGVTAVIYSDGGGIPGGNPDSSNCLHQGSVVWEQYFVPTDWVASPLLGAPSGDHQIDLPTGGVALTGGTTYWLGIMAHFDNAICGQAGWTPTLSQTGSVPLLYSNYFGIYWTDPFGYNQDMAFCLHAGGGGECDYIVGDVNGSDNYNGLDITYGVNFFKYGNPAPQCNPDCPPCAGWHYCGDVNNSCNYNGLDITYGVNYFKYGSPTPIPCVDCPPAGPAGDLHSPELPQAIKPKTIDKKESGLK